jgi:lycopene cyclase domain-containing protein
MTYLLVNIGAISIPFLASFHPKLRFNTQWVKTSIAIFATALPFILWDMYYTSLGVWGFNPMHLTGVNISNLPLEEVLFFICIPYSCLFTWYVFRKLIKKDPLEKFSITIAWTIAISLIILATIYYNRIYTSITFILTGIYLILHITLWKGKYLKRFWTAWFILLLPFIIVNGVLTGSYIPEEVVWYNPDHHMGPRIFTIPVEDTFYGLLMILMNVHWFEFLESKKKPNERLAM